MLKSSLLYASNLGTFWLKIEQFWPFEEISIFSYGGHLGYTRLPAKMATKLKMEKMGGEILIVHCCFSISQNELKF
jgi:hypothetical protein